MIVPVLGDVKMNKAGCPVSGHLPGCHSSCSIHWLPGHHGAALPDPLPAAAHDRGRLGDTPRDERATSLTADMQAVMTTPAWPIGKARVGRPVRL